MELKIILQLTGIVLGLIYLWLEYKANIWLWLIGLIMPCVHGYLYFTSGLYADCAMNGYYILAGIYGWIVWARNKSYGKQKETQKTLEITHIPRRYIAQLFILFIVIQAIIRALLIEFTNSTVPFWDSFTTATSIIAMWMLSRKYVEQWLVWIVTDAVTVGLYIYKGIPLTAGLYALYTILAVIGYIRWKKIATKLI